MPSITADQARMAGALQTQIDLLNQYIVNLQAAMGTNSVIEWAAVRMGDGVNTFQYETPMQMDSTDTASVINGLISVYQKNIADMQQQIAAIGT